MENATAKLRRLFALDTCDLRRIVTDFQEEMSRGLRGEKSSLQMLPAYVGRPQGTEKGKFIVLDLGGTNLRIMKVLLDGKRGAHIEAWQRKKIPPALRRGRREQLFDFLAQTLKLFLTERSNEETSFAFTFSFPMAQKSLSSGVLLHWTKGFTVSGVEGEDVASLLAEAMKREGLAHLRLRALLNDTVATLLAASYGAPKYDMAVILGTGTNACYPEALSRLRIEPGRILKDEVIVNLEWGSFNRLPVNDYDHLLDIQSPNPGQQIMEKMVSGLYTGELVRLALLDVMGKEDNRKYLKPYSLSARKLASLATGLEKEIADVVFFRSARIVGAAIVAVITWIDAHLSDRHRVAIDGALFTGYPGYRKKVEDTICELLPEKGNRIELNPVKEGSAIGAAVACALGELQAKSF